jgi:hypothetical protein
MAVLGLPMRDRMVEYDCINLLPDLEDDVFAEDVILPAIEESFSSGLDDWWAVFIADVCL